MRTITLILSLFFSISAISAENSSYQEEYIFLKNQLESLKSRKTKTIKELQRIETQLKNQNSNLNLEVSKLNRKNELLKTKLSKFDENKSSKEFNEKKIGVVLSQMQEAASNKGYSSESYEELNKFLIGYLEKGLSIHKKNIKAFNHKGLEVSGESLNLGHTASFFLDNGAYKSLVQSKNSKDLYFGNSEFNPADLALGKGSVIPVEFKNGSLETKKTFMTVLSEKLEAGGAVGYIIILLGLLGLVVAFIRYSTIKIYSQFNETAIREIVKNVQNGNIDTAKKILYNQKTDPFTYFIDILFLNQHKKEEVYESIVIDEIAKVQNKVSKYGPYLIVLAAVAPLLGLLGTVTGMIGTFEMITVHGTGNPKLLSGGIKEALVTTQMGLIVAIPCILAGNFLSSKASKVVTKFEEIASAIPRVQ